MELRTLRYFLESANENNMSRAADKLHVSQPSMSKQLSDLEEELGVKLFIRTNYGIRLTEEGLLLKEQAADIIALADKTEALFRPQDELYTGNIYIGLAEARSMLDFAEVLKILHDRYPGIRYNIFSGNMNDLTDRLDRGLLEFAVISNYVDQNRYNYLTMPKTEHWGLLMKKEDPLANKESLTPEDLFTLPLICSVQWVDLDLPLWLKDDSRQLNITATYNLSYNAGIMVRAGLGYAVVYDGLLSAGDDLVFVPLNNIPAHTMYIIWRKNRIFTPAAAALLRLLREHFDTAV